METSQYAGERQKRIAVVLPSLIAAGLLAAGFLVCGRYGLVPMGCVVGYALALRRSYRSLGGMNGDVAGYALTWGELCAVAVYALI